jgi:hypothetical protein
MSVHRYGDERIVDWLNQERGWTYDRNVPYHPRSDTHGGAQCRYFVDDLMYESDAIREAAQDGELVFQEDYEVGEGGLSWNTDLVIGPPANLVQAPVDGDRVMAQDDPAEIYLAVDAKSIMTEHQKARRNRQRDINSFADIMHHHHQRALTAGILLVNVAEIFDSPLRDLDDITDHVHIDRIVGEIIDMFDSINRSEGEISANLDGAGIVVVEHSNLVEDIGETQLMTEPPAPQSGDRVHYRTVVGQMADWFEGRFLA